MGCLIYVSMHYSELGITLRNSQIQKNNWYYAMIDINGPHAIVFFPPIKKPHTKYRIYSINRPGRLLNFWILRADEVGAY